MLDWQEALRAFSRTFWKTGNKIATSIAMIAITTNSSIKVKPGFCRRFPAQWLIVMKFPLF
jgi:hypothetical protein